MKKYLSMLVALAVTLFATSGFAWSPPASPAPASWISDTSHVLSDDAHARLDAKLKVINQSSANEIAALVLQTLDGQDIADVTNATFKSWGVGKKGLDNGVLVVLAIKDRKMRIETGKGVEGDLPDLKTQDIQVNVMRPRLRSGDVEGALGAGFDAIASSIANHKADMAAGRGNRQAPSCQASSVGSNSGGWVLLLVAGGAISLVWYLARQAKRRRQAEEAQRLAALERQAARRRQIEEREEAARRDAERKRQLTLSKPTPVAPVPSVPRPSIPRPTPVAPKKKASVPRSTPSAVAPVAAAAVAAAAAEETARRAAEAAKRRREQDEADARRAREKADEDRRRRDREEEDRRSSYSSSPSSSFDWGGSSGGSDSGGFGGGDSGGGGSSGDW